ncbi:hypothetical protein ACE10Z_40775 [Bradyrhizobium sp. Pha-3]|uniref:hypothetical protein n=1 Tax=Bradyrhizobium sp. Pha-3 TaxID=208375 RepID=UPI0035D3EBF9
MLHDAGRLAQFFEASLRRKQLEFDFRLIAMPDGNGSPRIGHDRPRPSNEIAPGMVYEGFMTMTRYIALLQPELPANSI